MVVKVTSPTWENSALLLNDVTWTAAILLLVGLCSYGAVKLREAEERRQADLDAAEKRNQESQREAALLKKLEQTRRDLKEFRRLADEARFYARGQRNRPAWITKPNRIVHDAIGPTYHAVARFRQGRVDSQPRIVA